MLRAQTIQPLFMIVATVALMRMLPVMSDTLSRLSPIEADNVYGAPAETISPVHAGDVTYITGGIGDKERAALSDVRSQYNVRLLNTSPKGAFITTTHVTLRDSKGAQIVDTSAGPIFMARLPAGTYKMEASTKGQIQTENIRVGGDMPVSVHLNWY